MLADGSRRNKPRRLVSYVVVACGFEACSAVLTARALALVPFCATVTCCNLGLGLLAAIPFWLVGARKVPEFFEVMPQQGCFIAAVALAFESVCVTLLLDPRGLHVPVWLDVDAFWLSVEGATRETRSAMAYFFAMKGSLKPQALAYNTETSFAKMVPRGGSRARVMAGAMALDGLGSLVHGSGRMSDGGAMMAMATLLVLYYGSTWLAEAVTPSTPAEASPLLLEAALFGGGLALGVAHATWTSTCSPTVLPLKKAEEEEEEAPTLLKEEESCSPNVAWLLSVLALVALLPYALLLEGPEVVAWSGTLNTGEVAQILRSLLLSATASHLSRELQSHLVPKLPPWGLTAVTGLRRTGTVLAIAAVSSAHFH